MSAKKIRKNDEYITYRVVLAFVEAAVLLYLMSRLNNALHTPTMASQAKMACLVIAVSAAAIAIFGAALYITSIKRHTYKPERVFNGMFLCVAAAIVAFCAIALYIDNFIGMPVIYVFVPASAVLFLIYNVYPKHLFITSTTHFVVAYALYALFRLEDADYRTAAFITGLSVCLLAAAVFAATRKNKGCIKLFGVSFLVFGRDVNSRYIYVLYGVTTVLLAAAYAFGGIIAMCAAIATVTFLVCSVVYGTVKLL